MRLYIYKLKYTDGFAPNPFGGYCTLATCKPEIRKSAKIGDLIVGIGSKSLNLCNRIIYYMYVDETMSFCEYWADSRFFLKRPDRSGSDMVIHGDNIYHKDANGKWLQEVSAHRTDPSRIHQRHLDKDTHTDRVLVGKTFVYWGRNAPMIPKRIQKGDGHLGLPVTQGHRCNYSADYVHTVVEWLDGYGKNGVCGLPIWLK